jgi:hypothetical protein
MKTQDDIDAFNKRNSTADRRIRDKNINRFEVIDETGRVVVKYGVSVELLYQDDGRTLKVFLKDKKLMGHHES